MFMSSQVYKIEDFDLSSSELDELLSQFYFRNMTPAQTTSNGWVSPYGEELSDESLVRTVDDRHVMTFKMAEKKLNKKIVDEQVVLRFQELKKSPTGPQKLDKKLRKELSDSIKTELLPQQKPESKCTNIYIDSKQGYLVVEGTNAKKAEAIITLLKRAFEAADKDFKISSFSTVDSVTTVITNWFKDETIIPSEIELGSKCTLSGQEGQVVKYDKHELSEEKLKAYIIQDAMDVAELQINYDETVSFNLASDLSIRGVKLLEGSETKFGADEYEDSWDASFVIISGIIGDLFPKILDWFGGEAPSN